MTTKSAKKGKHPGAVDNWLDGLGFYRKNVAYDETCLFRAVCEQLFDCQVYHERVRRECLTYARKNSHEFRNIFKSSFDLFNHLDRLEKHMVVCGNVELQIISRKYNKEIMVFDAAKQQLQNITRRNLPESLLLCLMGEDHYDVVYKREHIVTAGFCQSIIYRILYENVYKIPNVLDIVNGMLYEKTYTIIQNEPCSPTHNDFSFEEDEPEVNSVVKAGSDSKNQIAVSIGSPPSTCLAPFPFKVAKALDPTIYRNIEYDSWTEVRRELRLGEWYYGDDKLILGTKCIYTDTRCNNNSYECYIQDILKEFNKCTIYITKLAEKRTVDYCSLSPEDDAKPWPLPYRFSKNLVLQMPEEANATDKNKTPKKRRDKRRTQSCSEVGVQSGSPPCETVEHDINAYVGAPLQMQNSNISSEQGLQDVSTVSQEMIPANAQYPTGPSWNTYITAAPEQFWPNTPTTPQAVYNYNVKPVVASAPVTPDVIPYHEVPVTYYCNYQVDPYQGYNTWVNVAQEYSVDYNQDTSQKECVEPQTPQEINHSNNGNHYIQIVNDPNGKNQVVQDRPILCTTLTQAPQPIEMYSPMIPMPGTPIVYAQPPPQPQQVEVNEAVVPTTPVPVFSPSVENMYMSPAPFIYPPTPPASWYPSSINAQGFIFPPPVNTAHNISQ